MEDSPVSAPLLFVMSLTILSWMVSTALCIWQSLVLFGSCLRSTVRRILRFLVRQWTHVPGQSTRRLCLFFTISLRGYSDRGSILVLLSVLLVLPVMIQLALCSLVVLRPRCLAFWSTWTRRTVTATWARIALRSPWCGARVHCRRLSCPLLCKTGPDSACAVLGQGRLWDKVVDAPVLATSWDCRAHHGYGELMALLFRAVYTGTRPGLTPAIRAGKGWRGRRELAPRFPATRIRCTSARGRTDSLV